MAYNFPDNPVQDQEFTPPGGNQPTYIWQSPRWIIKGVPPANSGGIVDAPNDGQQYGRQSAGWTVIVANPTWTTLTGKPATFPPTLPILESDVTNLVSDLALKSPLASPVFTGDPRAPTPAPGDNDTSIATTAFVAAATSNSGVVISDTPPTAVQGKLWFDSVSAQLYVSYNDGNSAQWVVAVSNSPDLSKYVAKAGDNMTGNLVITKVNPSLNMSMLNSGEAAVITGYMAGLGRWQIGLGDSAAESTGNAGSNFVINRFSDAGVYLGSPISINRASGVVTISPSLRQQGVTDGSVPAAGLVGEVLTAASAGGTSVPNQTPVNIVTLLLSPGDWDVWGTMMVMPTVGTTQIYGSVSTVSATLNGNDQRYGHQLAGGATFGSLSSIPVPAITVNVSVPTNVYLVAQAAFASGTCTGGGKLIARRRR
jgi:hypothetical protein